MLTATTIAQVAEGANPILPSNNQAFWGAIPILLLVAAIIAAVLVARYFRRLLRSVEAAANRAEKSA